ncbi:hypothetical protein NDU88_000399 [Pleurodeles waltl]|uniref:Uncharacterized protein n=1 Tax=Pleurodeles waltl TaxID=8319 RepID=A0AAV7P0R8_PLEWA|nr:hypothetical protein NDU88_000399 [Pleurodeles waltl]
MAVFRDLQPGPWPLWALGLALPSSILPYPEGPGLGVHWAWGGFLCQFGFRGARGDRAPYRALGQVLASFSLEYPEGPRPGNPLDLGRLTLPVRFQEPGRPWGGIPCPGLHPPAHRVARRPGQGLGRTPMHGCVQRALAGPRAPAPCRALGKALPSSSLPYPEGPGSLSGPGRLPLLVRVQSPHPGLCPQAPEARAPGEPLRPRGPVIWSLRQLASSGCAPCIPMSHLDGPTAPDVPMRIHLLHQALPGFHEVGCVLADGPLRPSVCTEYKKVG